MEVDLNVAKFSFVVEISTSDTEILSDMSYRKQSELQENIRKRLMKAVSDYPYLAGVRVFPVIMDLQIEDEDLEYAEEDED
ncbi:MAG: hypothetical protein RBR68_14940 [Tenuifilaceae bacterium]|nr:hypothetical protein [Tenuifilaceae bacterium]